MADRRADFHKEMCEQVAGMHSMLGVMAREAWGDVPLKLRTSVWVWDAEHSETFQVEVETLVPPEFEQVYQDWARRQALQQAKDILEGKSAA